MLDEYEQYTSMIRRLAGATSAAAINNRGLAHAEIGEVEEALEDFATAMEIEPSAGIPYVNRGDMRRRLGQLALAVEDYVAATVREPSDAYFRRTLAHALHALGRFDEAVAEYDVAIELQPDFERGHEDRERAAARLPPID
jgi:tetratricopeptide (TPR) repeat protein